MADHKRNSIRHEYAYFYIICNSYARLYIDDQFDSNIENYLSMPIKLTYMSDSFEWTNFDNQKRHCIINISIISTCILF